MTAFVQYCPCPPRNDDAFVGGVGGGGVGGSVGSETGQPRHGFTNASPGLWEPLGPPLGPLPPPTFANR